ncbi:hypothetical protein [Saccharothrix syringae]|uniref:Uncharacterized protein n=1 Tax=Saccharothrix syringae TaxID=103733 RepID=A0A5Q0H980_SACSY|nr:hypothetical protein [Saccharothrix syringae]QFZ22485.1 hypothetical protein EKG83_38220 [Saccharothrix syringae]
MSGLHGQAVLRADVVVVVVGGASVVGGGGGGGAAGALVVVVVLVVVRELGGEDTASVVTGLDDAGALLLVVEGRWVTQVEAGTSARPSRSRPSR